jgi:hypothetical protein
MTTPTRPAVGFSELAINLRIARAFEGYADEGGFLQ